MNELDNLEQELSASLNALDKPCGCQEKGLESENPFADLSLSDNLASELEFAIAAIDDGNLSAEDAFEFASVAQSEKMTLSEIVSILERHPGLKITLSL